MSKATGGKSMACEQGMALGILVAALAPQRGWAQQAPPAPVASSTPVVLTLKHAVELSLSNSKDIQLAKLQVQTAQDTAQLTRAEFLPNLYAGSGAGYTSRFPETPGRRPPG